jgi:hypothetical protein
MSIVSHNSLKYKPYEYKAEEPKKESVFTEHFIVNTENNFNNENSFSNSLNFSRLKNYLKSYFITKREPDENQNV